MEVSNLTAKLKLLKLEFDEDLIVHLVLISHLAQFGKFKLISHYVQEEEKLQRDKTESAHFASTSENKKRKNIKGITKESCKGKKLKKNKEFTCFFCKNSGHMKKQNPNFYQNSNVVGFGFLVDNLYIFDVVSVKITKYCKSVHERIQRLVSDEILEPLNLSNFKDVLELIHTNLCGPFPATSWNEQQYFITYINYCSRYVVKSDCGGEYYGKYDESGEQRSMPFILFLRECGIVPQYIMLGKPNINDVVERRN
ncbi:hypothetical protein CR513_21006, partial [Mucuna pruriens]